MAAHQVEGSPEQDVDQHVPVSDPNGLPPQQEQDYGDELDGEHDPNMHYQAAVSSALAEQRQSKKRAQDDVKLLANRIALLKLEEKKVSLLLSGRRRPPWADCTPPTGLSFWLVAHQAAFRRVSPFKIRVAVRKRLLVLIGFVQAWKKIEETKKKAIDIMKVRQRNAETRQNKDLMRAQKEAEDRERMERNAQLRENQKQSIKFNQQAQQDRNAREADQLKRERKQHQEFIDLQKKSEEVKAQTMKHMIKNQKEEQRELRQQELALKRQQQRLDLIRRINEENEKRIQIQTQVSRLEKEEAEWIRKLQNTSQIQAAAFSELEVALNGDPSTLPKVEAPAK